MRILYLGDIGPGQTCRMRMRALGRLGHDVRGVDTVQPWKTARWWTRQVQRRRQRGSIVDSINRQVLAAGDAFRPQLVWADKQEYLRPDTLSALKGFGAKLLHFTPDPYFTLDWKRTDVMDEALRAFDVLVICKAYEMRAYEALGRPVVYMPLGYCDETHRPLPSNEARWNCAVGFLGGWEPRRERLLGAVARSAFDLKIWGGYWDFLRDGVWSPRRQIVLMQLAGGERFTIHRNPTLARAHQGGEVYDDDYARALTGSRIGLGLLRRVCPDQHTTRTFEIPACGSMLLADRTAEHQEFFEEGIEAEFFSSQAELLSKLKFYAANEPARHRIAAAGRRRCRTGRYAYVHRMAATLERAARIA